MLFTGHRGSGKSTELHRLETEWKQSYHVIYMEVDEDTDINDVAFTDLYLLVLKYLEFSLRNAGIKPDTGIFQDIETWFAEVTTENTQTVESSVSVDGEATLGAEAPFIAKLLVKLFAQIKGTSEKKKTIRQTFERDFSQLKAKVNLFLDDSLRRLQENRPGCKGILLIFDNLDRCPPAVAERLFFDYAAQLQELHCSVIYTVPISTLYSQRGISNSFEHLNLVPMLAVYQWQDGPQPLTYDPTKLQQVAEILKKRIVTEKIFENEADLLTLVEASGGHVRHLMMMAREACLTAIGREHNTLQTEDIDYAVKQLQFDFERQIPETHYPKIAEVERSKQISNGEVGQMALFNLSVLEYNGARRWNYPHPLVRKIEQFQDALALLPDDDTV